MSSKPLVVGLLAAGCLTAAAGGSYLAVRQNAGTAVFAPTAIAEQSAASAQPVTTETEALVAPVEAVAAQPVELAEVEPVRPVVPARVRPSPRSHEPAARREAVPAALPAPTPHAVTAEHASASVPEAAAERPVAESLPDPAPIRANEPTFDEITIPSSSVMGLEIDRTITSEHARIEDRVEARVTRDVYADGRLAVPAGSRVTGNVTEVERGGKMKDRARLGVRFHTLVLADGRQVPIRTDTIFRDGDSPGVESTRKIGGAAVGGAVLGAILGGGKGALAGAAAGAAGGTAVVMAGGRNAATLAAGSVVTVRLSAPAVIEIER